MRSCGLVILAFAACVVAPLHAQVFAVDPALDWKARIEQGRAAHDAWLAAARIESALPKEARKVDPLAHLTDATLERGDAVMTQDGLFIFRGVGDRYPHAPSDFERIGALSGLRLSHRGELLEIGRLNEMHSVR